MKKLLVLLMLLISSAANAATWYSSEIKWIYPVSDGSFIITFKGETPNCSDPSNYHYVKAGENGMTAEGVKVLLSVALSAATTGRKLAVNFDETSPICAVNRAYVAY